ncbi:MAG: hypothetical protein ABJB04_01385 [Betaproteobacteria bacterium]
MRALNETWITARPEHPAKTIHNGSTGQTDSVRSANADEHFDLIAAFGVIPKKINAYYY